MSVAKIIEVSARSAESFDKAIEEGLAKAGESVHNIQNAWVKDQQVIVNNGNISEYGVSLKITFLVD
ncbi:MAG: dodecin family protein [Actinomycetota bacterium]